MNQWKKLISLNLALAMVLGMFQPMAVFAADEGEERLPEAQIEQTLPEIEHAEMLEGAVDEPLAGGTCGADLTWALDSDGTLTISGTGEMYNYNGSNQPWYNYYSSIKKVVLEEGVTAVGDRAFYFLYASITEVSLPSTLTAIGSYAFHSCAGLTSVIIPEGVTTIESYAFSSCDALTSAVIPGTVTSWGSSVFYDCYKLASVTLSDGLKSIADGMFAACTALTQVDLPDSVTSIGSSAFKSSGLTSVDIPDSVTSIVSEAFRQCGNLTTVTIGSGIKTIGDMAFAECDSLTQVDIDAYEGSVSVGTNAFHSSVTVNWKTVTGSAVIDSWEVGAVDETDATATLYADGRLVITATNPTKLKNTNPWRGQYKTVITSVEIGSGISNVPGSAFAGCTALTSVSMSDVTSIETSAFRACTALASVSGLSNVTTIDSYAFYVCTALASVSGLSNVTTIDSYAFSGCTALTSVSGLSNVTTIGSEAFRGCTALASVSGLSNVTTIGSEAFYGCTALKNIYLGYNLKTINYYAFGNTGLTTLAIPSSVTSIGDQAFYDCRDLTSITWDAGSCFGFDSTGRVFGNAGINGSGITLKLGSNVKTVPAYMFYTASEYAGTEPKLTAITGGSNVTAIGDFAFYRCLSLQSVELGSSLQTIGAGAFNTCSALTQVTFPESLTSIGDKAFFRTGLTAVYTNEALSTVGNLAFSECPTGLMLYVYTGSPAHIHAINNGINYKIYTTYTLYLYSNWDGGYNTSVTKNPGESVYLGSYSSQFLAKYEDEYPGLELLYWSTNKDGTGTQYDPWSYITLNEGMSLYAQWKVPEYCYLTLYGNFPDAGSFGVSQIAGESVYLGSYSDAFLEEYAYEYPDVELLYWSTNKDGTGTQYDPWSYITLDESMTLYAQWKVPEYYRITLYGNHPDGKEFAFTVSCVQGEKLYLSKWTQQANELGRQYRIGLEVSAWTTTEDATDPAVISYGSAATITPTEDMELYAQWQAIDLEDYILDEDDCGVNASWVLYDFGTLVISGTGLMEDWDTKSIPWRGYRDEILQVIVESGITNVGEYAFYQCSNLTQVSLPDTINYIGYRSFYYCKALEQVDIDTFEMRVQIDNAFNTDVQLNWREPDDDELIATYYMGLEYETDVIAQLYGDGRLVFSGVGMIRPITPWDHCSHLITSISVGSGITGIYSDFSECWNLVTVSLPDTLQTIGSGTFEDCESLEEVTIDTYEILVDNYCTFPDYTSVVWLEGDPDVPVKTWQIGDDVTASLYMDGYLEIDGTGPADSAPWTRNVTAVTVAEGVTELPAGAFADCYRLTSAVLPSTMQKLSSQLFAYCYNLSDLTLSGGPVSIGSQAFIACDSLVALDLGNNVKTIGSQAFVDCGALESIALGAKLETIGSYAFAGCYSLTSVTLPESLQVLGAGAFRTCEALTEITIPAGITRIEDSVFEECSSLTTVVLPDSVTEIGSNAFYYCRALESINLSDNITFIEDYAFYYCRALGDVNLDGALQEIGRNAFYRCTGMETLRLSDDLEYIGTQAFSNCTGLTEVDFENSACAIGKSAFANCTSLQTVSDTENVYDVGSAAFSGCTALTSVDNMPELTKIASSIFEGCTSLQQFAIGEKVKSIGAYAFSGTALTDAVIPDSVTAIYEEAFHNCSALKSLTVGAGVRQIGEYAFLNLTSLENLCWNTATLSGVTADTFANAGIYADGITVTFEREVRKLPGYLFADDLEDTYAPAKVKTVKMAGASQLKTVGAYAFYCNPNVETVDLGNSLMYIGECAFNTCTALTSMVLPDTLQEVGIRAFFRTGLQRADLGSNVYYIGEFAFAQNDPAFTIYGCSGSYAEDYAIANEIPFVAFSTSGTANGITWDLDLETGLLTVSGTGALSADNTPWSMYASEVTSLEISDGITAIGAGTFSDCTNLRFALFGADLTQLANTAFNGCNRLSEVVFQGDVPQLTGYYDTDTRPFVGHSDMSVCYTEETANWSSCQWTCCTICKITLDRVSVELQGNTEQLEYQLEYQVSYEDFVGKPVDLAEYSSDLQREYFLYASDANLVAWNAQADGSGKQYAITDKVELTEDLLLYAQWAPSYDVDVSLQDDLSGYRYESTYKSGALLDLSYHSYRAQTAYYRVASDADLVAWNTEADFSGTSYAIDESLYLKEDLDLYAQWQYKTFTIDGEEYPVNESVSGDGWRYEPGILTLQGYHGGSISHPLILEIYCYGENTVNGSIFTESRLYLDVVSGITTVDAEETAIAANNYVSIYTCEDAKLTVTAELAVYAEDLHFNGYGTVEMTASGDYCLYATGYARLYGGEMVFRAAERALRANRRYIDSDLSIYLSEDAETPAPSYKNSSYLRLVPQYNQVTLHANGGTWSDQEESEKTVSFVRGDALFFDEYTDQLSRPGYVVEKWMDEEDTVTFLPYQYTSQGNLVLYAIWTEEMLEVGGEQHSPKTACSGTGWSFTPADGDEYAKLTITEGYNGQPIYCTEDLDITINTSVSITGAAAQPAIKILGYLTLTVSETAEVTLQGGSGTAAVSSYPDVQVFNYGSTTVRGGDGGYGFDVWTSIRNAGSLSVVGGLRSPAVCGIDIYDCTGTIVLIAGAECSWAMNGFWSSSDLELKFYTGNSEASAVRSDFEFTPYVRVQPKTVVLTLNANGGIINGSSIATEEMAQDAENTFLMAVEAQPKLAGYTFVGWNTKADGSGTAYIPGESYTVGELVDNVVLFAQWEPADVEAQFTDDGLLVSLPTFAEDNAILMVAAYNSDGKMLQSATGTLQSGTTQWVFDLKDDPAATEWKLMLLDGTTYAPIRDAYSLPLNK